MRPSTSRTAGRPRYLLLLLLACAALARATPARAQLPALEEQAFQQAAALADPSVVRIETVGGLDVVGNLLTATGPTTGAVVSEDGYIITSSFNFASRPASVIVTLSDDRRFPAEVVATDGSKMLTLLKIDEDGLVPLQAVPKSELRVGQWAIALGRTYDNAFPSVSVGIISALDRIWGRAVQTDAKVSPVNYGGPLVDIEGRAIGVLVPLSPQRQEETAGVEWYDGGIGFAIPMEDIYAILDRLKSGEELKPGKLGISFEQMGPLAGQARIDRVRPTSPADEAGLLVDDVITSADGKPVRRIPDLQHILGPKYAGEEISVTVRRGEEEIEVRLTLAAELKPYESGYLGILPTRLPLDRTPEGVEIREILADSPAASAGLQPRDVVTAIGDAQVASAIELLDQVGRMQPGESEAVTYLRGGEEATVEIEFAAIPDTVPESLPTANIPAPEEADGDALPTGRFTATLPGGTEEYWAYVPQQYNPSYAYAMLVWLHPAGDTMEASMMRLWQTHCDRRGIILVGPKAADINNWTPEEAEFVRGAAEQMIELYSIDPARVVVHGHAAGGQFAWHVGFKYRDLFPGIAASAAPLQQPPPDNDPDFRQQLHLLCRESDPSHPLVTQTAQALREQFKFPVTLSVTPEEDGQYLSEESLERLALWLDAIDRI